MWKKRYIVKDLMFSGWIVHVYTWVREFPIYLWLGKMHKYFLQREFQGIQQNKRKGGSVLVLFWKGFCIKINHIWERTVYHFPFSYHTLVPFYFFILYHSLKHFFFLTISIFQLKPNCWTNDYNHVIQLKYQLIRIVEFE